jgi:hypothetical protein
MDASRRSRGPRFGMIRTENLTVVNMLVGRLASRGVTGEEVFDELLDFVSESDAAAGLVLKPRGDVLLPFHRFGLPATLRIMF